MIARRALLALRCAFLPEAVVVEWLRAPPRPRQFRGMSMDVANRFPTGSELPPV